MLRVSGLLLKYINFNHSQDGQHLEEFHLVYWPLVAAAPEDQVQVMLEVEVVAAQALIILNQLGH
jgi:hypothetical protein